MDAQSGMNLGARRNEDIALDLLKFVSVTAGVGRLPRPRPASAARCAQAEEHVNQLLELYSRCLKAVEGQEQAGNAPQGWTDKL